MRAIAEKLGMADKLQPPEQDERTDFWLYLYALAGRGRPYTYGAPLPIPPLDVLALCERLELAAQPDEVTEIIAAMDDAWLEWAGKK